jgi:hypothetical protein
MTTPDAVFASDSSRSKPLLLGVILVVAFESVGFHAYLYQRSVLASLLFLAVNLGTIWWLIREFRSEKVTLVRDDDIIVRFGTSVSAQVPLASVRDVRVPTWKEIPGPGTGGFLQLAAGDDPNVLLHIEPPVSVRFPLGLRKSFRLIGLRLDDPQRFVAAVQAKRGGQLQ